MSESPTLGRQIYEQLYTILAFVGLLWAVFLLTYFFPDLRQHGLRPRSVPGAVGIVTMPFLHGGWQHLVANTMPLVVLLILLTGSQARSWVIVAALIGLGGSLLWLFGRAQYDGVLMVHIGASGLVFGLVAFLITSGLVERRILGLLVALLVGFLYGFAVLRGMLPFQDGVSWDGHAWGAVAGVLLAFALAPRSLRKRKAALS